MTKINPYLDFDGNAEEAFNFYRSVFGGEFAALLRWKEMPESAMTAAAGADGADSPDGCAEMTLSEADGEKIMHIALPIGENNVLMASDALESMPQKRVAGNNFSISVSAASREEFDRLFEGLSDGGTVTMPPADAFWGSYFGMLTDRFGVQWMFSFEQNQDQ